MPPQDPQLLFNHAMDLHRQGRLAEAEPIYRELHRLHPGSTDILHLLGLLLFESGNRTEGIEKMEAAIRANPRAPHYYGNLGTKLVELRDTPRALACLTKAIELQPDSHQHHYNLGNALMAAERWDEAVVAFREAARLNPQFTIAELHVGIALYSGGHIEESIAHYRSVLARRPDDFGVLINLGALLQTGARLDEAAELFTRAVRLMPDDVTALNNLAVILKERGEVGESVRLLRRCLELRPNDPAISSNLILSLHYDDTATDAVVGAEHREWNRRHAGRATPATHPNTREPGRRLRIGYVSADLRDHVVGRALLPSFRRHDHAAFEIHCYAAGREQPLTESFRAHADVWHRVEGMSDEALAEMIRADGIDILVDLAQHTSENRLGVFARRPAPVQVSWLGCPESSGLDAIDYRITDRHLEPPGGNPIASPQEQAWLMPHSWTCHEPPEGSPEVGPLPALGGEGFTFGSFNNNCKISDGVLAAWARILCAVPGSRLMLLSKEGSHRQRITERLVARGVDAARIIFADYVPPAPGLSQGALLARYHRVDLALDTFPYNGMTTTLDALWMGVPVVSLIGTRNLGRAGLSLLSTAGLPEFARPTVDDYVDFAVRTAQDLPALAALRAGLRGRLLRSPLLDAESFTRQLESAFRRMWTDWCARPPSA